MVLSTKNGMAIRFKQSDARSMGRNSSGVKGINLVGDDEVVGMVVADPDSQLLTACANGYGKRTPFGPNLHEETETQETETPETDMQDAEEELSSTHSYRTQRRGGKGIRDIKTTQRNGPVIGAVRVTDEDELLMITAGGKLQRIAAAEVSVVGRNTQGVRIMNLGKGDKLVAVKRVPKEEGHPEIEQAAENISPAENVLPPEDISEPEEL